VPGVVNVPKYEYVPFTPKLECMYQEMNAYFLHMIGGAVGDLGEDARRRFQRIGGFEVRNTGASLAGQNRRGNQIDETQSEGTHERIVYPFVDFMAERLHVQDGVPAEGAAFGIGSVDPGVGRGGRRAFGIVITERAAARTGTGRAIEAFENIIRQEDRQNIRSVDATGDHGIQLRVEPVGGNDTEKSSAEGCSRRRRSDCFRPLDIRWSAP